MRRINTVWDPEDSNKARMCVGLDLRHPEQVALPRIQMPGSERKGLCKQVCWRGGGGGERKTPFRGAWAWSPDTFPEVHLWESLRLGMGSEGAKSDLGFCGLGDAF